jgi:F-type H+-transporting ATPase subunit b
VLTASVTVSGASVEVRFPQWDLVAAEEEHQEVPESDLNPIAPEPKEMIWGFGSFVVFALLMRFVLFPRLKVGMDARYSSIRDDVEGAETLTASARTEVARYEAQLASVKAEANARIETARATLESERQARLAEANARIGERRTATLAEVDAARAAAQADVETAVASVAARASELATGRRASDDVIRSAVAAVMGAEVAR